MKSSDIVIRRLGPDDAVEYGVEPRAIRVGDTYFGKNHMIPFLAKT